MVNSFYSPNFERNISPDKIEELSEPSINLVNENVNSQELARITAYMMYCNFDNRSMDRTVSPETAEKFMDRCTGGLTLFDEEYNNVLEKNISIEFYLQNRQYDDALGVFFKNNR